MFLFPEKMTKTTATVAQEAEDGCAWRCHLWVVRNARVSVSRGWTTRSTSRRTCVRTASEASMQSSKWDFTQWNLEHWRTYTRVGCFYECDWLNISKVAAKLIFVNISTSLAATCIIFFIFIWNIIIQLITDHSFYSV